MARHITNNITPNTRKAKHRHEAEIFVSATRRAISGANIVDAAEAEIFITTIRTRGMPTIITDTINCTTTSTTPSSKGNAPCTAAGSFTDRSAAIPVGGGTTTTHPKTLHNPRKPRIQGHINRGSCRPYRPQVKEFDPRTPGPKDELVTNS